MLYFDETVIGTLIGRRKRFFMDVLLNGEQVVAHIANTGSMLGLLESQAEVVMTKTNDKKRALPFSVQAIKNGDTWVGVNTLVPNRLIKASFGCEIMSFLAAYPNVKTEVPYGKDMRSRIDFLLSDQNDHQSFIEVKSVTLKQGNSALFPDSVSERALKHVDDLLYMKQQGHDAGLIFVVQRDDCQQFQPATAIDKRYSERLAYAYRQGLWIKALSAKVSCQGIRLEREIDVVI